MPRASLVEGRWSAATRSRKRSSCRTIRRTRSQQCSAHHPRSRMTRGVKTERVPSRLHPAQSTLARRWQLSRGPTQVRQSVGGGVWGGADVVAAEVLALLYMERKGGKEERGKGQRERKERSVFVCSRYNAFLYHYIEHAFHTFSCETGTRVEESHVYGSRSG